MTEPRATHADVPSHADVIVVGAGMAGLKAAQTLLAEGRSVAEIVLEEGLLTEAQLNQLLELEAMTHPSRGRRIMPPDPAKPSV